MGNGTALKIRPIREFRDQEKVKDLVALRISYIEEEEKKSRLH